MMLFNVAPFEVDDEEHDVTVRCHNSNIGVGKVVLYV